MVKEAGSTVRAGSTDVGIHLVRHTHTHAYDNLFREPQNHSRKTGEIGGAARRMNLGCFWVGVFGVNWTLFDLHSRSFYFLFFYLYYYL